MSISFEENVRLLEKYRDNARYGAEAVANAMARYIAERTANETLTRRRSSPGTYYRAKRGEPPSQGSGTLAKSMYWEPASGGLRASAVAATRDPRARLFEFGGCVLTPNTEDPMKWKDSGGWWSHRRLPLTGEYPEHPFLGPTTEDAIDDGELRRVAIEAGRPFDP